MQSLSSALGTPPAGVFPPETFRKIGTEDLLKDRSLPSGRACLEPLRLLSLECLEWKPEHRPVAQNCLETISDWLSCFNGPPSFVDLWQEHVTQSVLTALPESDKSCPGSKLEATPAQMPTSTATAACSINHSPGAAQDGALVPTSLARCVSASSNIPKPQEKPATATFALGSLLGGYDSDGSGKSGSEPSATPGPDASETTPPFFSSGTVQPAFKRTPSETRQILPKELPEEDECICERKICSHHKGPCTNVPKPGSLYCDACSCQVPDCEEPQVRALGFCHKHAFRACAPEMQLVRALGAVDDPPFLDQTMCPADVEVFCKVCADYIERFDELDPVFELIAAWLKHPLWIEAWGKNKQEPGCHPTRLLQALHQTIREMSNQHDPEASFNLRSGRGLGFTVCCFKLNVAEKVGAAEPAADEELVHNLGSQKKKTRGDLTRLWFY